MFVIYLIIIGIVIFFAINKKNKKILKADKSLDDVTKMNGTPIHKIINVSCSQDISSAIKKAVEEDRKILPHGTRHTMGGQCLVRDGYAINMTTYNKIIDSTDDTVTVQAGITWSDLIHYLNQQKKTLETLQSYSSFSAGGSISANIHGITSDNSLQHSIISMKIIVADGTLVETSKTKNFELFAHVIGGFGMFGIISEITIKTKPNYKIKMYSKSLKAHNFISAYLKLVDCDDVCIKLGRPKTTDFNNIILYYFVKNGDDAVISKISDKPHNMSKMSSLVYKWLMDLDCFQNIRFYLEKIRGNPLDWSISGSINENLYESTDSISELWSPIFELNKTHILKEYFVPIDKLEEWLHSSNQILQENNLQYTSLLNATIRFVKKDTVTVLNYATDDMFAIVLFFRLNKQHNGDYELRNLDNYLRSNTLEMGGTFYLPYRPHHKKEDIIKAYPRFINFVKEKYNHDPKSVFVSNWWHDYCAGSIFDNREPIYYDKTLSDYKKNICGDRQKSFFHQISTNHDLILAANFCNYVFPICDSVDTLRIIKENQDNFQQCYQELQMYISTVSIIRKNWNKMQILYNQANVLTNQTVELIKQIRGTEQINGIIYVGDPGRYMKKICNTLNVSGDKFIVHDKFSSFDIIETSTILPSRLGQRVTIDYDNVGIDFLKDVCDESVDLVTLYIGLHHFKNDDLHNFLNQVQRVLRPNGLFILRDHNATDDIVPLLNFAHSYFNALTEVSYKDEINEFRNFRTIQETRQIISKYDMIDSQIYKKQHLDPTENHLMAFIKKQTTPNNIQVALLSKNYKRDIGATYTTIAEWYDVARAKTYADFILHTPWYQFPFLLLTIQFWTIFFQQVKAHAHKAGWTSAILNDGVQMDLFIGIYTSVEYIAKSMLALPIRMILTMDYFKADDNIEFIAKLSNANNKMLNIQGKWTNDKDGEQYYLVRTNRYLPFTETMCVLSENESNKIVEIAGHKMIQIRITYLNSQDKLSFVVNFPTIKITSKYVISTTYYTNIVAEVSVIELLNLIRVSKLNNFIVAHIYAY